MKQIRLLAQYYVDFNDQARAGAVFAAAGFGAGGAGNGGADGGHHGAAWPR